MIHAILTFIIQVVAFGVPAVLALIAILYIQDPVMRDVIRNPRGGKS